MVYTLDNFGKDGDEGEGGTSLVSLEYIYHWMEQYQKINKVPLELMLFEKNDAKLISNKAEKLFKDDGCIFASIWLMGDPHYVTIIGMNDEFAYIFDPYYVESKYFSGNENVEIVKDSPFSHNRKVKVSQLFADNQEDYCLINNGEFQQLMIIRRAN